MGKNISETRSIQPILWISTLYFAMGVPFVTINAVSGIMYKDMGISDSKIAFWTALILFSWTLKPLWSPFLEIYKTKKFFVVFTQFAIGILFALIAFTLPLPDFFKYSIALFAVVAFCGATHDIAADGTYINFLTNKEQARYIGWQGAFYNLAKIVSSGVLVYFAGVLEKTKGVTHAWMIIMGVYSFLFFVLAVYHYSILPKENRLEKQKNEKNAGNIRQELLEVITFFFKKRNIMRSVLFIILYRFAEGFAIKIAPLFFKAPRASGGLGLSTSDIGLIYGTYGSAAFILGSVLAGYFISARGLKKSLIWLCCAFNIPFVVYALLAHYQPDTLLPVSIAVIVEYFGYGFGFVGLMLYMMQQIAPGRHKTAHYAFATGIMNLGVMIPGMFSGIISDWIGYKMFFIWVLIAAVPAFLVTLAAPFPHPEKQKEQ
ncbi:PAT family beta-lactamase induction signal transducer AmpG [Chryseobacterium sp. H1D6B]|uniref:MFS transporter n=1 Tax=Chryseobacterium sp. H1D6B TaxID=2940588 RepID=UPI0015CA7BF8|nr:MFS transporter [Chryseobacterium sp. H1D6B]MDH6251831.1 PAT family beta-lactamase induction signal transducer AmpG [Chryseobacterium sp. H1D6B]